MNDGTILVRITSPEITDILERGVAGVWTIKLYPHSDGTHELVAVRHYGLESVISSELDIINANLSEAS